MLQIAPTNPARQIECSAMCSASRNIENRKMETPTAIEYAIDDFITHGSKKIIQS